MGYSGVNQVQELIVLLDLVIIDVVGDVYELYHRCILILFIQFCYFNLDKLRL